MQRTGYVRTEERPRLRTDLDTWVGNSIGTILSGLAIAGGVIGMMVAFGMIGDLTDQRAFEDGISWMTGSLVLAIVGTVFRREHHVVDMGEGAAGTRADLMKDTDAVLGNMVVLVLASLAVASAVIGMLVAFETINEGNVNPFQDGMVWFVGGLILAVCANTFRREHHVSELHRVRTETPAPEVRGPDRGVEGQRRP